MTSLKELPENHLVILLASRFNLNQGGHFYWYTKEIVAVLNLHQVAVNLESLERIVVNLESLERIAVVIK